MLLLVLWYVVSELTFALVIQYHPITFISLCIRVSFQQQYYCAFFFCFRLDLSRLIRSKYGMVEIMKAQNE